VPRSAWWSGPAFTLLRETNEAPLPGILQRPVDRLRRRAGRLVFTAFADGWATEAPPFRIPPELQRSWHLRTGTVATGVRKARREARVGVRAAGRRLVRASPAGRAL
jgi:hypothetical protein